MASKRTQKAAKATASAHFTHFDADGGARMVDVGGKPATRRIARAGGRIVMLPATLAAIEAGRTKKGDVLAVAQVAAIMAVKRTSDLIPLCHPLALTHVGVVFAVDAAGDRGARHAGEASVTIEVTCETRGPTGVEMEALVGATAGLLTIYDMCKAVDRAMRITDVRVLEKEGGKSGRFVAAAAAAVSTHGRNKGGGPTT